MKKEDYNKHDLDEKFKDLYNLKECSVSILRLEKVHFSDISKRQMISDKYEDKLLNNEDTCYGSMKNSKFTPKNRKNVTFKSISTCTTPIDRNHEISDSQKYEPLGQSLVEFDQSNNLPKQYSKIKSFYEYNSIGASVSEIPSENSQELTDNIDADDARWHMMNNAPSTNDIRASLQKAGIYKTRDIEKSVVYSVKEDAKVSGSIDIGRQKIKVEWDRKLPEFKSQVTGKTSTEIFSDSRDTEITRDMVLQCTKRPPSSKVIELNYKNKINQVNVNKGPPTLEKEMGTKLKIRMRIHSGSDSDSSGSTISQCSDLAEENDVTSDTKEIGNKVSLQNDNFISSDAKSINEAPIQNKVSSLNSPRTETSIWTPNISAQNLLNVKKEATGISNNNNYTTVISMECFVKSRQKLLPDPEFDPIEAIFYYVENDMPDSKQVQFKKSHNKTITGVIIVDPLCNQLSRRRNFLERIGSTHFDESIMVESEECLFVSFIDTILQYDPDMLVGYDSETYSFGFLARRAAVKGINFALKISRTPDAGWNKLYDELAHDKELKITGRIVLNVWRVMRSEISTLTSFTFENVCHKVLKERHPCFSYSTLTQWWISPSYRTQWRVIQFYSNRARYNLLLLNQLDVIGKTSEMARLFGIQFLEVMTRGSQFRVESIMLRLSKARNFIPVSPSVKQRAKMRAPEYLPLVMEPESRFYGKHDPVIVLDFQSLYPSIIMAYNYCYSTCLGRVVQEGLDERIVSETSMSTKPFEFGCTRLKLSPRRLSLLHGKLNFSPGGIAFLKAELRKGIVPIMLEEIIKTRLMVKRSMKFYEKLARSSNTEGQFKAIKRLNDSLQKLLHARQLGLKLIANVTYGYTSANFSGRMPCIEVGDSVVSKGRETLERAIQYIEFNSSIDGIKAWNGCRVVYGDTDSLFVVLPGRTIKEAFKIGNEMAKAITMDNPKPVKLKFEKVYSPCILQTKKRYVGYMYESVEQNLPVFDAKGIETVRRDGIPLGAKILEKSLRLLFESEDLSQVKKFVQLQLTKIMVGRTSLQDLTFAREFRGISGYKPGACVPSLELTRKAMRNDRMAIPPVGWRVPYVIIHGEPGRPLIHSVRRPEAILFSTDEERVDRQQASELYNLNNRTIRPNDTYYIMKVVAPVLSRCFSLLGVDVVQWYNELPKVGRALDHIGAINLHQSIDYRKQKSRLVPHQGTITNYFVNMRCIGCEAIVVGSNKSDQLCPTCIMNPQKTVLNLHKKIYESDRRKHELHNICLSCANRSLRCQSLDCPVIYSRLSAESDIDALCFVNQVMQTIS